MTLKFLKLKLLMFCVIIPSSSAFARSLLFFALAFASVLVLSLAHCLPHLQPAVNRQLGGISPLAFKAFMVSLAFLGLCLASSCLCFVLSLSLLVSLSCLSPRHCLCPGLCLSSSSSCLVLSGSCLGFVSVVFVIFVLSWSCLRFVLSCFVFVVLLLCRVVSCCVALVCVCVCVVFFSCLVLSCAVLCVLSCSVFFCFGRLRGRLASFLVVLGVVLGQFWSSWGLFWPSWGVLGPSWDILRRSWGRLTTVSASKAGGPKFTGALLSVFGSILGAKKAPRRSPRRPKIDQKIVLKNDRVSKRS